tara:strand:+ start:824 stop:2761 length:1938 start_codon:yes stop_codon:yes gene_type:complete
MAPKNISGLNIGDTDALLKALGRPRTFSEIMQQYNLGLQGKGALKDKFIPPLGQIQPSAGESKIGSLFRNIGNVGLGALDQIRGAGGIISAFTDPIQGNIIGDYLNQESEAGFKQRLKERDKFKDPTGQELFLPQGAEEASLKGNVGAKSMADVPGMDVFTPAGQDALSASAAKAIQETLGKNVGDPSAFGAGDFADTETIKKVQEQVDRKEEQKEQEGTGGVDADTDFPTLDEEVEGADTAAKKATVKALDSFLSEVKTGKEKPKTFDQYINEFGEATGLDISGEADTKQALMSFGLALMQNRAGKGFDVSKILSSVGEAGEAAMPDFRKAVAKAEAIRAKAGSYALGKTEEDKKKAMNRKGYVVIPKEGGLANSVLQNTGRFSRLNSYELNNLDNNAEFNKRFAIIDAATYTDMTKSLITASTKDKKKTYLEKPRSVPLFGGSKITFDVFYANPNNPTGAKSKVVAPDIAVNAIETMEKGLTRRIDKFRDIAKVINETGVSAGDQIRSFGNQLAISFGIPIGKGETDPVKRLNVLLTELKARNAAAILGESGKTISDNDRRLVDDIVGAIDVFSGDADIGLLKTKLNRLFKQITLSKKDEIDEAYSNLEKFGIRVDRKGAGTLGTKMILGEDNVFRFRPQETT